MIKIQDAIDLFTGNNYIIAFNDGRWDTIQKRLYSDNYTPYNYIYFLVFHLSGKRDFSNICKKSYATSDAVYIKFKQFMTNPQTELEKILKVALTYATECNKLEGLLSQTNTNPVIILKRYKELCTRDNEDLEQQALPYILGHPVYASVLGKELSEDLIDKYKKRGIVA